MSDAVAINSVVNLINQIKEDSPSTRVGVSAILVRTDNLYSCNEGRKSKQYFKRIYCNENFVPFMGNANI